MPIYEFTCVSCESIFEILRPISRMNDDAPCPKCDGTTRRELSVFSAYSYNSGGEVSNVAGSGGCGGCSPGGCACSMTV